VAVQTYSQYSLKGFTVCGKWPWCEARSWSDKMPKNTFALATHNLFEL